MTNDIKTDSALWDCLTADSSCSRPLDNLIAERLSAAIPSSSGEDARQTFAIGMKLLCASLNKGDTFLPLAEEKFEAAVRNWLDIPEDRMLAIACREKQGTGPAGTASADSAAVRDSLLLNFNKFTGLLEAGAFDTVVSSTADHDRPLVYDPVGKRLFFQRYFLAVKSINTTLAARLGDFPFAPFETGEYSLLQSVIGDTPPDMRPDTRQTAALLCSLRNRTLLVSGGPGTGKTTVVLQILRLFMRALPWLRCEDIRIAASTGRAASRLQESIVANLERILCAPAAAESPNHARDKSLKFLRGTTVHRLLEYNPSTVTFRRSRENPLCAAIVIVDEVSMLDIELFGCLLDALQERSVLILLGDRFQLPPVEAGAVLGDLTAGFDRKRGDSLTLRTVNDVKKILACNSSPAAPAAELQDLEEACGTGRHALRDRAIILTRSHRSAQNIRELAMAVNSDGHDPMAHLETLAEQTRQSWEEILAAVPDKGRCLWTECGPDRDVFPEIKGWLLHHFGAGYRELLEKELIDSNGKPTENTLPLLDKIEQSRILTVVREGARGSKGINEKCCCEIMRTFGPPGKPGLFHGLPVIISRNAPTLGLYNGDCGVMVREGSGDFAAVFRIGKECIMRRTGVLPAWEPAFAMTVHKSQGSEYERVLLVLPARENPLCTREILYTAVTRAKKLAAIIGPRQVLEQGIKRMISRNTGIEI